MRNGQNKHRMRGRNRGSGGGGGGGKNHNPLTRVYESNGPDVKIRGTANHVAEKYIQLARDATASGDPVAAENYYQHAEHYFRLIAAAQEQFRQSQPYQQRSEGEARGDDSFDEGDDQPAYGNTEPHSPREQAQYQQRESQPYQQSNYQPRNDQPRHERNQERNFDRNRNRHQQDRSQDSRSQDNRSQDNRSQDNRSQDNRQPERSYEDRQPQVANGAEEDNVDRLPSFITGAAPAAAPVAAAPDANGHEGTGDRFPLNRRRGRRPRTPRAAAEGGEEAASSSE